MSDEKWTIKTISRNIVLCTLAAATLVSAPVSAEPLTITMSEEGLRLFRSTPIITDVEAAFENTPYELEWVPVAAGDSFSAAASGEHDGTLGNIPLGTPELASLVQVPVVIFRQGLFPVVLSGNECPAAMENLQSMKIQGVENYVMFDAAETRLRFPIPRVPDLPTLIDNLKSGETEITVAFDYTLPGLKASYDLDLKLCEDIRIKSYQYFLYLHESHADKVADLTTALRNSVRNSD